MVQTPPLVCVQIATADREQIWFPDDTCRDVLRAYLRDPECVIVGHNFSFDLRVLLNEWPDLEPDARAAVLDGRILDTMVLAHLREPDVAVKSLEALALRYLNVRLDKDEALRTSFRRGVPLSAAQRKYAIEDALVTRQLFGELRRRPLGSVYAGVDQPRHEVPCPERHNLPGTLDQVYSACAIVSGVWVEPRGWTIDVDCLTVARDEARAAAMATLGRLAEAGLAEPARDAKAPAVQIEATGAGRKWTWVPATKRWERQIKGVAQAQPTRWKLNMRRIQGEFSDAARELKIMVPKTEGGDLSTRYQFWKMYRSFLSVPLQALLDYSKANKLETAFFASWMTSRTGRLYPQYWIPGTATLRHASSKPNLQQVPKRLRAILSKPGRVIVGADYSALEIYTLVHHMRCLGIQGPLYEMLDSGQDPHSYAAALLAGGTPAEHGKGTKTRQSAKACNFGVPGGLGAEKFYLLGRASYGLEWSKEEAADTRKRYLERFWDVAEYLQRLRDLRPAHLRPDDVPVEDWLADLGFEEWPGSFDLAKSMDEGRIFDVELSTGMRVPARNFTQAANLPFQHLGAVIITVAILKAFEVGLSVAAAVHDSLSVDCEPGQAETTARQLEVCMEEAFKVVCPLAPEQRVRAEIHKEFF